MNKGLEFAGRPIIGIERGWAYFNPDKRCSPFGEDTRIDLNLFAPQILESWYLNSKFYETLDEYTQGYIKGLLYAWGDNKRQIEDLQNKLKHPSFGQLIKGILRG